MYVKPLISYFYASGCNIIVMHLVAILYYLLTLGAKKFSPNKQQSKLKNLAQ